MLKNYFLFLFILGLNFGYSQRKEQKELPVPHIRLKAGVSDHIMKYVACGFIFYVLRTIL